MASTSSPHHVTRSALLKSDMSNAPTCRTRRFQTADPSGTKLISFETFCELMASKIDQKDSAEDLCDAFRVFDKDGKGLISVQELRYMRDCHNSS